MDSGGMPTAPGPAQPTGAGTLGEVQARASACDLCRLCHTRTHVVFGAGDPDADIMFVAEGPGYHEDMSAQPLSGRAGSLFEELLASIGHDRTSVYVTSVVKCRPPRNRSPFPDEIEACEGYLFQQARLVRPRVVCALGNVAIRLLTGRPQTLSRVHGKPLTAMLGGSELVVLPLYHPAAALVSESLLATLRSEFRSIPALLRGDGDAPAARRTAEFPSDAPTDSPDTQLTLNLLP